MAYTEDSVLSKLSTLNESQDSIATAAQWIMFHRRNCVRTVQLWYAKIQEVPSHRRLNMIYLANEVAQQTKARHKDDFLRAFEPIIVDAMGHAYKGASAEIQNKLRRVAVVWRDRNIFDPATQAAVEARLDELDRQRGSAQKSGAFGATKINTGSDIPPELASIVAAHQKLARVEQVVKSSFSSTDADYEKVQDPKSVAQESAPIRVARMNSLLREYTILDTAMKEADVARDEMIAVLQRQLDEMHAKKSASEARRRDLEHRQSMIKTQARELERSILGGLGEKETSGTPVAEPNRPQVEALTPPPGRDDSDDFYDETPKKDATEVSQHAAVSATQSEEASASGMEMLSRLASQYQAVPVNGSKKRKMDTSDDVPDLGGEDGLDPDVMEAIRKDSM